MYDIINNRVVLAEEHYIIPIIAAAAIGAGASLIGGAISAGTQSKVNSDNIEAQERMNALNLQFQREVNSQSQANFDKSFDYMAQQNLLQQQREDTAHQREVQDLVKAGLSPLANKSGATTGSMMSMPSSPMLNGFQGVAPQADATGFLSAGSALSHAGDLVKDFYSIKSENARAKAKNETDIFISSQQIAGDLQKTRELISSNESISESDRKNAYQISLDKIESDLKLLNLSNKFENEKQAKAMSHEMKIKLMDKGIYDFAEYTDYDEYLAAKASYDQDALDTMNTYMSKLRKSLTADSSGWNAGIDLGTGKNPISKVADSLTKLDVGVNGGHNKSQMESVDESQQYHEYMNYYRMHRAYPLYVGSKK